MIYTRKRQYDTLVNYLQENKPKSQLPKIVQDAMDHGLGYEPIARETYLNVMKYELRRDITIRETGLVIQPSLFWVAASPDGMVVDQQVGIGLIEIKCPKSKSSLSPEHLVNDDKFYVTLSNGSPVLKRNHQYYTQIQMAMGLAGASFCDFVVYTFGGIIISRVDIDHTYFVDIMQKINSFYSTYMLPKLLQEPGDNNENIDDTNLS